MSDGESLKYYGLLDGFVPLFHLRPAEAVQGHFISIIPVADTLDRGQPRALVLRPPRKGKDGKETCCTS